MLFVRFVLAIALALAGATTFDLFDPNEEWPAAAVLAVAVPCIVGMLLLGAPFFDWRRRPR